MRTFITALIIYAVILLSSLTAAACFYYFGVWFALIIGFLVMWMFIASPFFEDAGAYDSYDEGPL